MTAFISLMVLRISYRPVTCRLHSQHVEGVFPVRTQTIVPNNYFTPLTALIKGWRPFHSLNILYLIFLFQSQVPSQAVYHSFKISLLIWIYIPITSGSFHQLKLAAVASLFLIYSAYFSYINKDTTTRNFSSFQDPAAGFIFQSQPTPIINWIR